jgi:MoaA/NifB/PqqE/SkfB family radical SAM enzyme/uncharacterized protein YbjT (DUF2867 family)
VVVIGFASAPVGWAGRGPRGAGPWRGAPAHRPPAPPASVDAPGGRRYGTAVPAAPPPSGRHVAVLGATGRLGPAVCRALVAAGHAVVGLARRAPDPAEALPLALRLVRGERGDAARLAEALAGAEVIVDLCAFTAADGEALLRAQRDGGGAAPHLIVASSVAERTEPAGDPYADGKRALRATLERRWAGPLHTLLLPRLVAPVDLRRREEPALAMHGALGRVLLAGAADARFSVATVDDVAGVIAALAAAPERLAPGPWVVASPHTLSVRAALAALLDVAPADLAAERHPDPRHRGVFSGGDDLHDGRPLAAALPELRWQDPLGVYRALGDWLRRSQDAARRPRRAVAIAHAQADPRPTVDVHGRREPPALRAPRPALQALADRLAPAFYVDTGRPCNSACIYCAVPPHADTRGFTPLEALRTHIAAGVAAGCDRAILIGGEPTIYPRLFDVFAALDEAGLARRHIVMTNGLRLAEPGFVERLAAAGVATLHLSIDTADAEVYDRLSRSSGLFPRQRAGLEAALACAALETYVYAIVTALNADGLPALLRDLAARCERLGRAPPVVLFAFGKPVGDALTHADLLDLPPAARAAHAAALAETADELGIDIGFRNLTWCLAPALGDRLVDYYLHDRTVRVPRGEVERFGHHAEYLVATPACRRCAHARICPGVYAEDGARHGEAWVRPQGAAGLTPAWAWTPADHG